MHRLFAAVVLVGLPGAFGQTAAPTNEPLRAEAAEHVAELNSRFEELLRFTPREKELRTACAVNCQPVIDEINRLNAARLTALDAVASQIHSEVDGYILRTISPVDADFDTKTVADDLNRILADAAETPSAFLLHSANGRALIVTYVLHKGAFNLGERATSVTLRAYSATNGRLRLADFTGDSMDRYRDVSVRELHSPVPDEAWLLASGQMSGANGPNIRMRVYAFDGRKFRTIWMPANSWGDFTIKVTDSGFRVDGPYYRSGAERHDTYFAGADGLYLISSGNEK